MKGLFFAVAGGLALACVAVSPVAADEVSDPLAGMTTIEDAQLEDNRGGIFLLKHGRILHGESGPSELGGRLTSKLSGFGNKVEGLAWRVSDFGDGLGERISGPVTMGLHYVGDHIGSKLHGLPNLHSFSGSPSD